ncbi:MarR family winged helix-turn-helix transcriptional regulator [Methanobrevibacter sp.]|uniref:MarR family winged helix-turn-helix transcriptional regulator n=1 Tax=Methanobrevibacter sp. TaxID=66852 RepID=UPI0026DECB45|nr:MarR family winged helix-turn-helix transcriptional regulator [Methanobrevibacter sp.]MDO5860401.1 MarR family winged helix-turn-helix transcriptional regulator [Methanobrevibacter sp.]
MDDINWKTDRILLTPINLYMEYILLSYNDFLTEKLKDIEITHGELTYIYNIKYFPETSQRQLAEILYVSEANVAKMVKKLVKKGLVEKSKDKSNKSRNILSLTDKGESVFDKINTITYGWERDIAKKFTNEEYFEFKQKLYELIKESANLG